MTTYAYNGWLASKTPADFGGLDNSVVPGTNGVKLAPGVRAGDVATVFFWLAWQLDTRVEDGDITTDEWGYYYKNSANSAKLISCHSAGCAFDWNATRHPNGKRGTFSAAQVAEIRKILAFLEGVVYWGGDAWGNGTPDEMHWEIATGASTADVRRVAEKIVATYGPREKWAAGSSPAPAPAPAPVLAPAPAPSQMWREIPMGGVTELGTHGAQVAADQRDLADSGFVVGVSGADGYCGPGTVEAIKSAQRGGGIKIDGAMGLATRAMLHKVPSYSKKTTSEMQRRLTRFGYRVAIDGKIGPKTTAAIKAFQSRFGLTPDGECGPQTWTALYTR